ncbi:MAG: preprotein translocase subunit SecE [Eggerthellaceae bacterium]|nr:preprotein translocase subunit SecE [Eggerthellaceae bacterium]
MAQKSKSQRAKASAARAERKEAKAQAEAQASVVEQTPVEPEAQPKRKLFGKSKEAKAVEEKPVKAQDAAKTKKDDKNAKPKKKRFQFFRDVKAEMKRVTWPTRKEVIRWSVIVVGALLFFGLYVALLDNLIVTPLLVLVSSFAV